MSKTRMAVAGAGLIGQAHIRALQASPACAPAAVVAPSPEAAEHSGVPVLISHRREAHRLRTPCGEFLAVRAFGSNAIRGFAVEDVVVINPMEHWGAVVRGEAHLLVSVRDGRQNLKGHRSHCRSRRHRARGRMALNPIPHRSTA